MMRRIILVIALLLVVTTTTIAIKQKFVSVNTQESLKEGSTEKLGELNLSPQTNSRGNVTVQVKPPNISKASKIWAFEVDLETHTVELNQDLVKNSVILDDQGKRYYPVAWEGDPPGGHHRKGVLKFEAIFPIPKLVLLKINQIGDTQERVFKWELKY